MVYTCTVCTHSVVHRQYQHAYRYGITSSTCIVCFNLFKLTGLKQLANNNKWRGPLRRGLTLIFESSYAVCSYGGTVLILSSAVRIVCRNNKRNQSNRRHSSGKNSYTVYTEDIRVCCCCRFSRIISLWHTTLDVRDDLPMQSDSKKQTFISMACAIRRRLKFSTIKRIHATAALVKFWYLQEPLCELHS